MKKYFQNIFVGVLAAFALSSCLSEYEYTPAEPAATDCPGVYFAKSGDKMEFQISEVEPITTVICRNVTEGTLSVPLTVTYANEEDGSKWSIPTVADFADGEASATITLNYTPAGKGEKSSVTLSFDSKFTDLYEEKDGKNNSYTATIEIPNYVWEKAGVGFWIDGLICSAFSVDAVPMAVEYEKAVKDDGTVMYRFVSPYSLEPANDGTKYLDEAFYLLDEAGNYFAWNGYPYNGAADLTCNVEKIFITTKDGKATIDPFYLGNDYGYGPFNASLNENYFGTVTTDGDYVTVDFAAKALFFNLPDYGTFPANRCVFTTNPEVVIKTCYGGGGDQEDKENPAELTYSPLYVGSYYHAVQQYTQDQAGNVSTQGIFTEEMNALMGNDWVLYEAVDSKEGWYKLQPWISEAGALYFTMNSDNTLTVPASFTGLTHPTYGDIYGENIEEGASGYDEENSALVFNLRYFCSAGTFGYVQDVFLIEDEAAVRGMKKVKADSGKRVSHGDRRLKKLFAPFVLPSDSQKCNFE